MKRNKSISSTVARRRIGPLLGLLAGLSVAAVPLAPEPASAAALSSVSRVRNTVTFSGFDGNLGDKVSIFLDAQGRLAFTNSIGVQAGDGCTASGVVVTCGTGVTLVTAFGFAGNDEFVPEAPIPMTILGDAGFDSVRAGRVRGGPSRIFFEGGTDIDRIDYSLADRFVTVALDDTANDGRPGDADDIRFDVENITGSGFPDRLTGSDIRNSITGGPGSDVINGRGDADTVNEGPRDSGRDDISGGDGRDLVTYVERSGGVNVSLDGVANDGQGSESDNVRRDVERVTGGSGPDTLIGNAAANELLGNGGADALFGADGTDFLRGDAGTDVYRAGLGFDTVHARDGGAEDVRCGVGFDNALVDAGLDTVTGCESVS